jgi:signal peptidase I
MEDERNVQTEASKGGGQGPVTYEAPRKKHIVREYAESILIAAILALVIRTFVVQAFKIPSGSMEDTLLVGDHLLVNKFIFGSKIPFTEKWVVPLREPKRGDIIVFEYPEDTRNPALTFWQKKDFIKRVIGVPGDRVKMVNQIVYVNDKPYTIPQEIHKGAAGYAPQEIYNFPERVVPPGQYFCMGDNRDRSHDSRFWGFVPKDNIKGLAFILYWSWDSEKNRVRWERFARVIH